MTFQKDYMPSLSSSCTHLVAGGMAMLFAWVIFRSPYMFSAMQFVGPSLVIVVCHFVILAANRELDVGFSQQVFSRAARTSILLVGLIVIGAFIVPVPAQSGADSEILQIVGTLIFCLLFIACFLLVVSLPFLLLLWLSRVISGKLKRPPKGPGGDSRLFDFGSIGLVGIGLFAIGLEGLPSAYSYKIFTKGSASILIDAPAKSVWQAMATATQPEFPLPQILHTLPRPVAVLVDEGVELGSRRIVQFEGREGKGKLSMVVIERTKTKVVFEVLRDTSPIAYWMGHKHLTYEVHPKGDKSELHVSLNFNRKLAPSWFFTPVMKTGMYLAMSVLAQDTKHRAEALKRSVRRL